MSKSISNNKHWFISQKDLETWLDEIGSARTLIAPRFISGILLYRHIVDSDEIAWDGISAGSESTGRPILSAKEIFFPATERLFSIQKTGQEVRVDESFPEWETVVFGVRPCDARGIKLLDAVFMDTNPIDSFYTRRRENTTLIGMACQSISSTCFCTSVGGAPDDVHDVDIMVFKEDGGYRVEAVTEKGRFLIPGGEWKETLAFSTTSTKKAEFMVPEKGKWPEYFNSGYWDQISERCLSCRACAFVCPTCRCFAVRDEMLDPGKFERIRCWDACAGENYRRVAGGHKPRAEKAERLRNRFYCKFYYYPEQYGLGNISACTGCGRCIDVCPVGVDITEVLMDLETQE
jgi:sulfhydrogenase subunit beta (sulfur reductase)